LENSTIRELKIISIQKLDSKSTENLLHCLEKKRERQMKPDYEKYKKKSRDSLAG